MKQKNTKTLPKKRTGYTLIELMVVISVITTLALLSFNYYLSFQQRTRFENAFTNVITFLSKTRNMAITSQTVRTGADKFERPAGGYGIFFDTTNNPRQIILFGDIWNEAQGAEISNDLQAPVAADHLYTKDKDIKIETLNIYYDLELTKIVDEFDNKISVIPDIPGPVSVTFSIPFAEVNIVDTNNNSYKYVKFVFKRRELDHTKSISIHKVSSFFTVE